jgi:Icc-related predicted phosphoesterase
MAERSRTHLRIAAIGDIHVSKSSQGKFPVLFAQISSSADVLVLCGDFTDYGLPEEARILAKELTSSVKIPVVAVLGNHDYESGKQDEIRQILNRRRRQRPRRRGGGSAGGRLCRRQRLRRRLRAWRAGPVGERAIKQFVQEAVDEALKLESALARLRTQRRVAVLHYAPIRGTVEGEPPEILPYLGSSRLEEPINR